MSLPASSKCPKLHSVKGRLRHGLDAGEGEETNNYFQGGFIRFSHLTGGVQARVLQWNSLFSGSLEAVPRQPRIPERQLGRAAGNAGDAPALPARLAEGLTAHTARDIRIWHEQIGSGAAFSFCSPVAFCFEVVLSLFFLSVFI